MSITIAIFITNLSNDKFAHVHIYTTTLLCVFFWIKSNIKMSKFLTIQKPDIRYFSVSGFTATLKPDNFDGSNYKWWHARMILWLTAMSCYHTTEEKRKQFTPEEEQKFLAADNLFRGTMISALNKKICR